MQRPLVALCCLLFVASACSRAAETDYSQRLDTLWDFANPAASEARFRAEASRWKRSSREASEATTQLGRSLGLQRRFTAADRVLDAVKPTLAHVPVRVRVRYLLERGRRDNSSGHRNRAFAWFEEALGATVDDTLPGADYYRVDALHMLAIAAPLAEQRAWNLQALAIADASADPRTRGWRASLLNNVGWTMHERGDDEAALAYWKEALIAAEAKGDLTAIRIARWTVARGLRAVGRLDEAEAVQRALADELDGAHLPDGYVFEELAEIAVARGDRKSASAWAKRALALLSQDATLARTSRPGLRGSPSWPTRVRQVTSASSRCAVR